jgi:ribosome-binding ATPase YchF (GTP1/OBG family)
MQIGIVGMPNAGKTTLFNALTHAGAETADYPFTTVDPNLAVVEVPDERLAPVAEAAGASPLVPETIEFVDIAGLVRGAHEGEGLGNQFLAKIREMDAIVHVVRCHGVEQIPHPEGDVDPARDAKTVEEELRFGEIEKPTLYVANVDEGETEAPTRLAELAGREEAGCVAISARVEEELGELGSGEADEMRAGLGLEGSSLERLIRAAYELLDLITFFTAHPGSEAMARALHRGLTAYDAAGKVHTDIQEGFVRAEVIGWKELVDAGGYSQARERGLLRTEGRDYVVEDGDVITVKH